MKNTIKKENSKNTEKNTDSRDEKEDWFSTKNKPKISMK